MVEAHGPFLEDGEDEDDGDVPKMGNYIFFSKIPEESVLAPSLLVSAFLVVR